MSNLFVPFRRLFAGPPLQVCAVISASADGAIVALPGGAELRVRGTGTVGENVFVRNGVIEGPAPNFTPQTIEI